MANAWKKVLEKVDHCETAEQAIAGFGNLKKKISKASSTASSTR